MRQALRLHPDSPRTPATRIDVDAARPRPGQLVLRYVVAGAIRDLRLPPPMAPVRADGLWRHTCFEAFLRAAPGDAYYEFNFAPSRAWAAYRFGAYRDGMSVAEAIGAPRIEVRAADEIYELHASLDLAAIAGMRGDAAWRLGLSAVIEEAGGDKSYWALAHPPGRADFHHPDGFACELPAVARP
jgi:hypothetical protein